MPPKSNNDKVFSSPRLLVNLFAMSWWGSEKFYKICFQRKEAEAAGRVKQTKAQANAGKSAKQKKEELKNKKAADKEKKSGW